MTPEIKKRLAQIKRGEVPEGYKRTKAGIIPVDWHDAQIKEIADTTSGSTPDRGNPELWEGGVIPWVTTGELSAGRVTQAKERITEKALNNSHNAILPRGTILVAMYGQGKTRGTAAILEIEATINQACLALLVHDENKDYIFYQLQNSYDRIRRLSNTGGQQNLNAEIIRCFRIPLPRAEEQERIAALVGNQNKLITLKEQLIAEKYRQKQYLMQQLLTGRQQPPGFNGEWKRIKLGSVLKERKEKNNRQDLRICSVSVHRGVVDQIEYLGRSYAASDTSKYNVVCYGDIIYTKSPTGDFPLGIIKQSHMNEAVAVSPLYGVFIPHSFELGYILHSYFQYSNNVSNYLKPITQKGAKNTINVSNSDFLSNYLFLPSDDREIRYLSNILSTADQEIALLEKDLEQEKQKKKALMQLLLTGIVRV